MANVDRKFPHPHLYGDEVDLTLETERCRELAPNLFGPSRKGTNLPLTPEQDRLIRKALAKCPVDVIGKLKD